MAIPFAQLTPSGMTTRIEAFPTAPVAGASQTTLNFIEQKEQIVFVADAAQAGKELSAGNMNSAFSLHGLHQDRSGLRANGRANGVQISKGKMNKTIQERREALLDLLLGRSGNSCHGSPMEGILKRKNFVASGRAAKLAREFDEPFVRFGPAIAEEHLAASREPDQPAGKFGLWPSPIEV